MTCCLDERSGKFPFLVLACKYLSHCHRFEILLVRKLLTIYVILYSFA